MKKIKIVDPDTGKEIWVLVDENGNIIEKNVPAPEDTLTEEQKKILRKEKEKERLEKLETANQATLAELSKMQESFMSMSKMMEQLLNMNNKKDGENEEIEKKKEPDVVYVPDPSIEQQNKVLAQKAKEFDEYKKLQENKEFIQAQTKAKPFMADLIAKLGIKTKEDYIRIAMPLEEREEENAKLKEQIKNNQHRNPVQEYGMLYGGTSGNSSVEDKILKEAEEEVEKMFARLIS